VLTGLHCAHQTIIRASKDCINNKEGVAGKRKPVKLMIPQQVAIIRRLKNGESCGMVMASYKIGSSTIYDINKRTNYDSS